MFRSQERMPTSKGRVPFASHYIKGTCYQHDFFFRYDINLNHLAELMFVKFLQLKVISPNPTHSTLWKEVTKLTQKVWEVTFHLPGETMYVNFWHSSVQQMSSPFTYSIIYLYQHGFMNYLYYILGYNPVLCYLFFYSNCSSFGH